jgi:hypothetical protein
MTEPSMKSSKTGVTVTIPTDIWQPLMEIRSSLDASCPGTPTPVEEVLREVITHYERCPRAQDEAEAFCEKAKAWKRSR